MLAPLLVHPAGPGNGDLALLRPRRWWGSRDESIGIQHGQNTTGNINSDSDGNDPTRTGIGGRTSFIGVDQSFTTAAVGERLALDSGPIRQISLVTPPTRTNQPPRIFARCDYSATLVELRGDIHQHCRGTPTAANDHIDTLCHDDNTGRLSSSLKHAGVGGSGGAVGKISSLANGGLTLVEKLVFSRRLTCTACSPFTRAHAAFLDEDFRLFHWHPTRGAVMHGSGPLCLPTPMPIGTTRGGGLGGSGEADARRARNADVSLEYGHHPRVLWMAGQHRAYRVDLREKPTPATVLTPALDPGVYFRFGARLSVVKGGSGRFEGRGDPPKIRALTVGRRSVHEVFVGAGLHLACMDDRFPKDVVGR